MSSEISKNLDVNKPNWKSASQKFATETEAVQFVHDFWTHVLPPGDSGLERILSKTTIDDLKEETFLDRTVMRKTGIENPVFQVVIYRNTDKEPLTPKAIEFLQSRGIQGA